MADVDAIPLTRREFERALQELTREVEGAGTNPGSYRSESSARCYECMFTTDSTDCFKCTYCQKCQGCTDCTHCHGCTNCHDSKYGVESVNCHHCSYVIRSHNCYGCVFCFGCVGLVKKEFHILNRPFPRKDYFRLVEELKQALGLD